MGIICMAIEKWMIGTLPPFEYYLNSTQYANDRNMVMTEKSNNHG
jgi:hypothetical protein